MPKIISTLVSIAFLVSANAASAQRTTPIKELPKDSFSLTGDFERMKLCTPGTVDGTQIFLHAYLDGKCVGNPKSTLYIADLTLRALCSVKTLRCRRDDILTPKQAKLYAYLAGFRDKTVPNPRVAVRMVEDHWRFEMITGGNAIFSEQHNGARGYDLQFDRGCVYLGTRLIDCVDLYEDIARRLAGK